MKVMSIIGLVLATIYIGWLFLAAASNGHVTLQEFAPGGMVFGVYFLVMSIVGVAQRRK